MSCTVPREGQSTYDTLDREIQAVSDAAPKDSLSALGDGTTHIPKLTVPL